MTYTKLILKDYMDVEKDITIQQMKPDVQIAALQSNQVDAIFSLEPIASVALTKDIAQVLLEAPLAKHVMNPLPGSASTFSVNFVKQHPKEADAVRKAMEEAVDFIRNDNNNHKVKEYIAKWTPIEMDVVNRLGKLKYQKLAEIDKESVQHLANILASEGALEKSIDTSNIYYHP